MTIPVIFVGIVGEILSVEIESFQQAELGLINSSQGVVEFKLEKIWGRSMEVIGKGQPVQ